MAVLIMATEITGHGWGPGPWRPIFPLFWLFVPGIVIFAVLRFRGRGPWQRGHAAENVLAERYARGDVTVEKYRERLRVLKEQAS
jgi:putative membrane protein